MAKEKTVTLIEPIKGHAGTITTLVFREPGFADLMELGEPVTWARSKDNLLFSSEHDDVLMSYVRRCLVEPKDQALLAQVSLADGLQVKDAIHGFFGAAREAISKQSATS